MPNEIDREQVRRWVEAGAQLVEVLPSEEYAYGYHRVGILAAMVNGVRSASEC